MRLTVIGCGYVGLVTGACLAEAGHEVICTDVDADRIAKLNAGKVPIYEHHLDGILASSAKAGRISYTTNAGDAIRAGDAIFICVGTPPKESGEADLSAIDHVARQIATEARSPKLVIEKSTVPARTGIELRRALSAYTTDPQLSFRVVSNPEFLREGTAVYDFFHPDRIVVGVEDDSSAADMREIYRPILERSFACPVHAGKCPDGPKGELLVTTINSAELIKHASNSFLALKISYANVIANLCEKIGANVEEVTHAMGLDPRIGTQFLKAGLGFGGFCFPKDVQAFVHLAASVGVDFDILRAAERVNKECIDRYMEKVNKALWVVKGKRVAVLGLAFKANTDDVRFSPALEVVKRLLAEGAVVHASDPEAISRAKTLFPQVSYHEDPYEALKSADAALVCTEWDEFRKLDWERAGKIMSRKLVIDGRNLYDPAKVRALGFEYHSFGRA
ncbi:MAG TPA: UDP-glucose/GDP-mannose dehydrogenase family protein [Candidatus Saccharimonadales bacterium]|nr:UDP-glucose/GDP-mannose dehydrogenase family protein [Candidatus Saccharimonadales bacterium]